MLRWKQALDQFLKFETHPQKSPKHPKELRNNKTWDARLEPECGQKELRNVDCGKSFRKESRSVPLKSKVLSKSRSKVQGPKELRG